MDANLLKKLKEVTEEEKAILDINSKIQKNIYSDSKDFTVQSKKMLEKGKLIDVRTHTRFTEFPKHRHDYIEMIYMCSGSTTHIINDEEKLILKQGELLILNQYVYHSIEAAGSEDVAVNFIILPEYLDLALDMLMNNDNASKLKIESDNALVRFILHALKNNSESEYLYFNVADILPIQNLLENIVWTLINKKDYKNVINQTTIGLLFVYLSSCVEDVTINTTNVEKQIVQKVIEYIEDNYKNATLNEIATILNQTVSTLSRLIKEYTGKNFSELLVEKKLTKSVKLLENTDLSISQIVEKVGYDNSSYFYKIFNKKYNLTPRAYREKIKRRI